MTKETWKDVPRWEGYYQVSDLGRVKSLGRIVKHKNRGHNQVKKENVLNPFINYKGYLSVELINQQRKLRILLHRLVGKVFIQNPENKPQINHKDGNKKNNCVTNLEWCTNQENAKHAFETGLRKPPMEGKFGKDHNRSKAVIMKGKNGEHMQEFGSIKEANRETGINAANIQGVCCGRRKTAGGYIWEYQQK